MEGIKVNGQSMDVDVCGKCLTNRGSSDVKVEGTQNNAQHSIHSNTQPVIDGIAHGVELIAAQKNLQLPQEPIDKRIIFGGGKWICITSANRQSILIGIRWNWRTICEFEIGLKE